jgi:hypothetical protein
MFRFALAILLLLAAPAAADFEQPFASTSVWNVPISPSAAYAPPTTDISGYTVGLSSFNWAAGSVTITQATDQDPLINLYYNGVAYVNMSYYSPPGDWERENNSGAIETEIEDGPPGTGYNQTWDAWEYNYYSSTPFAGYKERTAAYWSLTAYVPADFVPTLDIDGQSAVFQPNGWVLEMSYPILMANGDIVAGAVSYTDPTGPGWGYANGRHASMIPNYAGTIRDGELTSETIPHALSLGLGRDALAVGHKLPAIAHDINTTGYDGTLLMGTHLAIPDDVNLGALGLATTVGATLAKAMQDHGVYITEAGYDDVFVIQVEEGAGDAPGWSQPLQDDLDILVGELEVVYISTGAL